MRKKTEEEQVALFWSRVEIRGTDDCWIWKWKISKKDGYGRMYFRGRAWQAQRIAYILSHEMELPPAVLIMQTCENKLCCNPAHLYTNSLKNLRRKMAIEGMIPGFERGEANRAAKLSTLKVLAIKLLYKKGRLGSKRLAKQYGVSRSEIRNIVHGRKWGWLNWGMSPLTNLISSLLGWFSDLWKLLVDKR